MKNESAYKAATICGGRVPDHNVSRLGDLIPWALERGKREPSPVDKTGKDSSGVVGKPARRMTPTNSEIMNRSLIELGKSAFKVHMLLWKWRGAPARGKLPFFTIHSLGKFCNMSRPTVRMAMRELVDKGWIEKLGYSRHDKNELYKLVPIRNVPSISPRPRVAFAIAPAGPDGTAIPRPRATI